MKKLNIAFVTIADLPEGGGNTMRLKRIVETLYGLGHRVSVWNQHRLGVAPPDLLSPRGEFGGGSFEYVLGTIDRGTGFASIGDKVRAVKNIAGRIRDGARRGALDVIWFNNLSFYDTWPLTRLARSLGIATIQAYEDERLEWTSRSSLALSRRVFGLNTWLADRWCPRMADAVVVISRYLREKYAGLGVAPGRLVLVPTIIDVDAWDCPPEEDRTTPRLLYSGAFAEQDEIDNMIRALARLRDEGCAFQAVMLGDNIRDPQKVRRVRQQIESLNLTDRVVMKGFVPVDQVKREICSANVLLGIRRDGPWARSGLPTKVSEYLASGRIVIASSVGGTPDYLTHGQDALLVSGAAGVEEIAEAVKRALSSAEARRTIGKNGQQAARRHFDRKVVGATLQAMLELL